MYDADIQKEKKIKLKPVLPVAARHYGESNKNNNKKLSLLKK